MLYQNAIAYRGIALEPSRSHSLRSYEAIGEVPPLELPAGALGAAIGALFANKQHISNKKYFFYMFAGGAAGIVFARMFLKGK